MGWLALGSPLGSTPHIQKFMSLSQHLELADFAWSIKLAHEDKFFLTNAKCLVPGGGAQITLYRSRTAYWPCWLLT